MIKKLQIKFVTITMSIFLAVFIAVLVSINIIMQVMMKSQSRVVLNQIATSIRYDEKTSTFSFKIPDSGKELVDQPADIRPDLPPPTKPEAPIVTTPPTETPTEEKTDGTQEVTQPPTTPTRPPNTSPPKEEYTEFVPPTIETIIITTTTTSSTTITTTHINTQTSISTTTTIITIPPTTAIPPTTENNNNNNNDWQWPQWSPPYWGDPSNPWWGNQNGGNNNVLPSWNWGAYPQVNNDKQKEEDKEKAPIEEAPPVNNDTNKNDKNQPLAPQQQSSSSQPDINTESKAELLASTKDSDIIDGYSILNPPPAEVVINKKNNEITASPHRDAATIDYFVLMADSAGNLVDSLYGSEIDNALAQKYINSILKDGSKTGMIDSLQYYKMNKSNGTVLVFTDKSAELDMLKKLTKITIIIGCISFILIAALVVFLSKISIAPVKKAFEKQKQFVSDASHELKTPLTIISTNADVLSDEIGENKWLTYIKSQTDRMSLLVNDLLNLTRIENNSSDIVFSEFNLSQAIMNTALPFECQAFETNKKFCVEVQDGIILNASERHIKQMAAIFIDNAIKHSGDNDEIKISLYKQGDKKIFSVFNTGSSIPENERDKIFERFYRSDASRARSTGGYGLGLAIAKSIIDFHKFKVNVSGVEGENVCFTVIM